MALGIPFLGSDLPRMKVLAEEYKVGSVISTLEASDIAKTIEELMNTPEQLKQMSKAARNHRQDFGWQNEFKSLLKFYKSLGITSL